MGRFLVCSDHSFCGRGAMGSHSGEIEGARFCFPHLLRLDSLAQVHGAPALGPAERASPGCFLWRSPDEREQCQAPGPREDVVRPRAPTLSGVNRGERTPPRQPTVSPSNRPQRQSKKICSTEEPCPPSDRNEKDWRPPSDSSKTERGGALVEEPVVRPMEQEETSPAQRGTAIPLWSLRRDDFAPSPLGSPP